jgi:hypothetical protein
MRILLHALLLLVVTSLASAQFTSGNWGYTVALEGQPPVEVVVITNYIGPAGPAVVPAVIDGKEVRSIGNGSVTIDAQSRLTDVVLPATVTAIARDALRWSTNLSTVSLGPGVKSIGYAAFAQGGLRSINISDSVTVLGDYAFYGAPRLTNVVFGNGITNIPSYAFALSTNLPSVALPPTVQSISDFAFALCTALTNAPLPYGVTTIGASAFSGCRALPEVVIPDTMLSIGDQAFKDCRSMTNLVLGVGLTNIAYGAFAFCDSLQTTRLPPGLRTVFGSTVYSCTKLSSLVVGGTVTDLGDYPFANCPNLTSVLFKGNAPAVSAGGSNLFVGSTNAVVYALPGSSGWTSSFGVRPVRWFLPTVNSASLGQGVGFLFSWSGTGSIPMDVQRRDSLQTGAWGNLRAAVTNGTWLDTSPPPESAFYRAVLP